MQTSLSLMKPESINQVYELLTNLHAHEVLKKTYLVELGTIEHPRNFTVMRMNPSDMPDIGIYCSLDLDAPYYLACYNLSALVWHI
jgi:hypothetical protein